MLDIRSSDALSEYAADDERGAIEALNCLVALRVASLAELPRVMGALPPKLEVNATKVVSYSRRSNWSCSVGYVWKTSFRAFSAIRVPVV